jgi:glycosyltransferase involved in cell wall biosynthesis
MDGLIIGCSARYHPMKDHRTFLRAAALLSSHRDGVHFVLAGRGVDPSNRELLAAVRSLGLELQVHLLGERQDMPRITAAFDIGTSSSQSNEGFSNAVGEAMACGVPCVVTDIGDSAFLVGDTGIVIPPLNPEALSNAWIRLVDMDRSSRESLGRAARQRIEGEFSISAVAAEYARIYEEVRRSGQSAGCP